jgi:hypothetical protein
LQALDMLKLAVMSSDPAELELAIQTGKVAVSNGVFNADLLYLIQHVRIHSEISIIFIFCDLNFVYIPQAESILYPISFRKRSDSESSDDDDSDSNQSIAAQSETHADTEFESDAVAAWAFRIEKQLSDAIQSGLGQQIDEALVLATEYRSAGTPFYFSVGVFLTSLIVKLICFVYSCRQPGHCTNVGFGSARD